MNNQFTLQGNPKDFNTAVKTVNDVLSLLTVMTGVDHSKAHVIDISVSIEAVAEMLGNAAEALSMLAITGGQ